MTGFILFFIAYFLLTFTLSKISEKEEIDGDGLAGFLLLFPPLYFLYITKRFQIMIFVTLLTYGLVNFLVLKGIPLITVSFLFIIPFLIGFAYILHNLRADFRLNLFNFFPPVLGSIGLLIYLAFLYLTPEEVSRENRIDYSNKNTKCDCDNENNKAICDENKSEFHSLNQNLFKEFDKLDYQKVDNEKYFGSNLV